MYKIQLISSGITMRCVRKNSCRNLIVLAVFLGLALWNGFVILTTSTDHVIEYIEEPGIKPHSKLTFLNLTAEKNIIQPERHFVNVSAMEQSDIYTAYTKSVILEDLAAEFVDGADLNAIIPMVKEQKNKIPTLHMRDIKEKIKDFQFNPINITIGKRQRDVFKLSDYISPASARNVWIVTRARSGSSFLGDMLSRYPGTFYSFEPLYYKDGIIKEYNNVVKQVFKCSPKAEYFEHAKTWRASLSRNFRLWSICQRLLRNQEACFIPQLYHASCPLFPIRLVKTIRFPFEKVEPFLLDSEFKKSLKIVFLFRDPRGVFQSLIYKTKWWSEGQCVPNLSYLKSCKMATVCNMMETDATAAIKLKEKYPDRVHLVRYEDLCLKMNETVNALLDFLDISRHKLIEKFISTNTHYTPGNAKEDFSKKSLMSTKKNSEVMAFDWRQHIENRHISEVQTFCEKPMKILGYNAMKNISINKFDDKYPLLNVLSLKSTR